jgi:hypothetical protein
VKIVLEPLATELHGMQKLAKEKTQSETKSMNDAKEEHIRFT